MRQMVGELQILAGKAGLHDITAEISRWVSQQRIDEGLLTIFCRHTPASLLIQENAAPEVRSDLVRFFARLAPEDPARYEHNDGGQTTCPHICEPR